MSNRKDTSKPKKSIRSGMLSAIVKKKKKSKLSRPSNSCNSVSEATNLSEPTVLKDLTDMEADGQLVEDMKTQLQQSQNRLEAAENRIKQDEVAITTLLVQLENIQDPLDSNQSKKIKMEEESEDVLDENSFFEAEVFKLNKQTEELQQELDKKSDLDKEVNRLTEELVDLQMQNQELRFQEERSSTRSKMKSIIEEKNMKEEIQRLQKELRTSKQNMKIKTSSFEAQLKASQDGKDRLQEKARVARSRFDELDKERLELKIANNRLQSKLEKSSMYAEKKRLQTEQETVELELKNLKRKNVKLDKQFMTASNQMLNMTGFAGSGYHSESEANLRVMDCHIPGHSLLDSKMINLEKEVDRLEKNVAKLSKENENLKENAASSDQTADVILKDQDDQLRIERNKVEEMQNELGRLKKIAAGASGEDYLSGLLKKIDKLEQGSKDIEIRFRVKEKDLWSTIEAQKKQIKDFEMKTLALELGENEEDKASDTEERDSTSRPENESSERIAELQKDIERLKTNNKQLEEDLQANLKQLQEAEQQQMGAVDDARQQELERLKNVNEHLRRALEESVVENQMFQSDFVPFQNNFKSLKNQNEQLTIDLDNAMLTSMQVPILQSEIERLKQNEVELENKIAAVESDTDAIISLEKEVEKLSMLNSQLMKDLEATEEELDCEGRKMGETEKIRVEIEKLKKQNEMLQTDLKSTEDELDKLEADFIEQIRVQENEIGNLKEENDELREAATAMTERLKPKEMKRPPVRSVALKKGPMPPSVPKTLQKVMSLFPTKESAQISLPGVPVKTKKEINTSGTEPSRQMQNEKAVSEVEETQVASSPTSLLNKP